LCAEQIRLIREVGYAGSDKQMEERKEGEWPQLWERLAWVGLDGSEGENISVWVRPGAAFYADRILRAVVEGRPLLP
jgi:cell wall assembly regulator SMI1